MLSPRWMKVVRDLAGNKTRTVLVVLSIAVGVFAIGMIGGTQTTLSDDMRRDYLAISPANATLFTDPFDESVLQSVRALREVGWAEGRRNLAIQLRNQAGETRRINLVAVSDYDDIRIDRVFPEAGIFPPGDREIVVERQSLAYMGLKVGDMATAVLADGRTRNLRVVGTLHDITKTSPLFAGTGFGYITMPTLEWLGAPQNFNQLVFVTARNNLDKAHIANVAAAVRGRIESSGRQVYWTSIPTPGQHPASEMMNAIIYLLGALGLVALLLSGFLVANTVSALLTQQRRQIGVMKAIGARADQVSALYLVTVLTLAAMALAVGIPLGTLGGFWMGGSMASMVNFDMTRLAPTPNVLALQFAVGLGVPLLAAVWPILGGVRVTAREAMSAHGTGKAEFGRGIADRLLESVRGLSRPTLLSLRNTFRRKGRLALTLTTLVLGGATFIAVFCVRDSTVATLDEALDYFKYDLEIAFRKPYRSEFVESIALRVPGVNQAESPFGTTVRPLRDDGSEGDNVSMLALKADTDLIQPILLEGRWLLPGDDNAVVLNSVVTQREPSLRVGSEVVFTASGRETRWTVVGIVRGIMTGPIAYANRPYFERAMRNVGRTGQLWIATERHDPASRANMTKALKDLFEAEGVSVGSVTAMADERARIQSQFDLLVVFLLLMAVLMAVVGGLGLMGTMSLNVLERTREIGVMRAIGASDGAVRQVFLLEGVLIGVLSWLTGAIVALPISQVLSYTVGVSLINAPLSYAYSTIGTGIWLAVVVLLSVLASILPARNASCLSVREILAYE